MKIVKIVIGLPRAIRLLLKPFVYLAFVLFLRDWIEANYRHRAYAAIFKSQKAESAFPEEYPDEWYWADYLCAGFGFFVSAQPGRDQWITRHVGRIN